MDRLSSLFALFVFVAACGPELAGPDCEGGECESGPVEAICAAKLSSGVTFTDLETEYLPFVIACEIGDAPMEALKAQAIAARSYAYYKLSRGEALQDGQADQVFTCYDDGVRRMPSEQHKQAVRETSGLVLEYKNTPVAAFYVAGAETSPASHCQGGGLDEFNTERFVTYNDFLFEDAISQSRLGWRNRGNYANRGCMSQNGAECLAGQGSSALDIITFYYGIDIEVKKAEGSCILPTAELRSSADDSGVKYIGDSCTNFCDANGCGECEVMYQGATNGECYTSYDPTTGLESGSCTQSCEGGCPGSRNGGTFCADIFGSGLCMVAPSSVNGSCSEIEGSVTRVRPSYEGSSGRRPSYKGVCVPSDAPTITCAAPSGTGECIDTDSMSCGGTIHVGLCPGGNNIRCCAN